MKNLLKYLCAALALAAVGPVMAADTAKDAPAADDKSGAPAGPGYWGRFTGGLASGRDAVAERAGKVRDANPLGLFGEAPVHREEMRDVAFSKGMELADGQFQGSDENEGFVVDSEGNRVQQKVSVFVNKKEATKFPRLRNAADWTPSVGTSAAAAASLAHLGLQGRSMHKTGRSMLMNYIYNKLSADNGFRKLIAGKRGRYVSNAIETVLFQLLGEALMHQGLGIENGTPLYGAGRYARAGWDKVPSFRRAASGSSTGDGSEGQPKGK